MAGSRTAREYARPTRGARARRCSLTIESDLSVVRSPAAAGALAGRQWITERVGHAQLRQFRVPCLKFKVGRNLQPLGNRSH
jgi:hypothetical protein